jgi:hypothetical protein
MFSIRAKLVSLIVVGCILSAAGSASAQGVGNLGSLPTVFTSPVPLTGWVVSQPTGGPVPVVLDPTGPAWGKAFTGPNGNNFFYPPTSTNNPPLFVTELLVVAGNKPWTDWHEEVIGVSASGAPDLGWTWSNPTILVNGLAPGGLSITGSGTNNLSFFFNSAAPGSTVTIRKDLVYAGPPGAAFFGTLAVHEYPTPEPASLALLGLGGLFAWRRRARGQA